MSTGSLTAAERDDVVESAVTFGRGRSLAGVVSQAAASDSDATAPWAIFLNAGLIHRVGPNRLYVRAARVLAGRGIPAFRFDLSGVGDSLPARDSRPVAERWVHEARSAMDFLERRHGAERFLLLGNCSGAVAGYLTAHSDPRVAALALVNPPPPRIPLRYRARLALSHPNFWRRLVRGGKAPAGSPPTDRDPGVPRARSKQAVIDGLMELLTPGRRVLIVSSYWDPAYDYFHRIIRPRLPKGLEGERLRFHVVAGSNHDFSPASAQADLLAAIEKWASTLPGARGVSPAVEGDAAPREAVPGDDAGPGADGGPGKDARTGADGGPEEDAGAGGDAARGGDPGAHGREPC